MPINPFGSDYAERRWRETYPGLMALVDRSNEVVDSDEFTVQQDEDGRWSVSTVLAATVDADGKTYLIPTLWDGKKLSGEDAWPRAQAYAKERGIEWPSFRSREQAEQMYGHIKGFMRFPSEEALQRHKYFDPEGSEYDYYSATRANLGPDSTGHWPSRNPATGLLLKGRTHKTWDKTVKAEEAAGYEIVKGKNGRYYSRRKK